MDIPDRNLFMLCDAPNREAFAPLPRGVTARACRRDELEIWLRFPFDDSETAEAHSAYMREYFHNVYAQQEDLFFRKCLFLCDADDRPIATCFDWKAYGRFTTLHWMKVKKEYEGRGLGRALLTLVLESIPSGEYPVALHTQPGSYRAIKLYTDFGFALLEDAAIGGRVNHLAECLPILESVMPREAFARLRFARAPQALLDAAASSPIDQF